MTNQQNETEAKIRKYFAANIYHGLIQIGLFAGLTATAFSLKPYWLQLCFLVLAMIIFSMLLNDSYAKAEKGILSQEELKQLRRDNKYQSFIKTEEIRRGIYVYTPFFGSVIFWAFLVSYCLKTLFCHCGRCFHIGESCWFIISCVIGLFIFILCLCFARLISTDNHTCNSQIKNQVRRHRFLVEIVETEPAGINGSPTDQPATIKPQT